MYTDFEYYQNTYGGTVLTAENADYFLSNASSKIDTLTFNRIVHVGINGLSAFQQQVVKNCCCQISDFLYENEDIVYSPLAAYSINGVSVDFSKSVTLSNTIAGLLPKDLYAQLQSSGLCGGVL